MRSWKSQHDDCSAKQICVTVKAGEGKKKKNCDGCFQNKLQTFILIILTPKLLQETDTHSKTPLGGRRLIPHR